MVVEWPFEENGAERIYTALVAASFCNCVLKLESDRIDVHQCENKNQKQ